MLYFIRSPHAMANPTTGYFTKVGAGIDSVKEDLPIGRQGIYNLQGVRLNTTPEQLPAGIYIIDGRKVNIPLSALTES